MSLPLDHSGMAVLGIDECLGHLRRSRVGRLAFIERGEPMILPVNHGMDGTSVILRTAPGSKLLAAEDGLSVAFEVDGFDPDRRAGWSVVVRGVASTVDDPAEVSRLNQLGVWPWADMIERNRWVRIRGTSITGRVIVHPDRHELLGPDRGESGSSAPELDVRAIPHAIRHATVFGAYDAIPPGSSLLLIAPHDPQPLLHQLAERAGGHLDVSYLERGPESWRLQLTRV